MRNCNLVTSVAVAVPRVRRALVARDVRALHAGRRAPAVRRRTRHQPHAVARRLSDRHAPTKYHTPSISFQAFHSTSARPRVVGLVLFGSEEYY